MVFRKFRKNFAIELDAVFLQFSYELAVGAVAIFANCGIHANDPQAAEVVLLIAPMRKRILAGMYQGLFREALLFRSSVAVPLRPFEYVAAVFC